MSGKVTRFQQLGAYCADWNNVTDSCLRAFSGAGGRYIHVLVAQLGYPEGHDVSVDRNLANIDGIIAAANHYGIAVGPWVNGWAGGILNTTANDDAQRTAEIVHAHHFDGPLALDLEAAYQWPGGRPQELPKLVWGCRTRMPTRGIIVSTNSPNDSMIFNGGVAGDSASMFHCQARLAPQWYPWMGQWGDPVYSMQWAKDHGMEDNWHDPHGPQGRAIPLSYIHGTLEANLESAVLEPQIVRLQEAQKHGFTVGFSVYLLESLQGPDFADLANVRGKLFLV